MVVATNSANFPCVNCSHSGICKYEEEVMSFIRRTNLPEQECLSIKYDCKYKSFMNTNLFGGYREYEPATKATTCNTTSRPYTVITGSECIN